MFYFIEPESLLLNDRLLEKSLTPSKDKMTRKSSYSAVETTTEYTLSVDLPGVKAEEVSVTYEDDTLSIKARNGNVFSKSFEIDPKLVNVDSITADLKDGVLTVNIPKPEPVRIDVMAADPEPSSTDSFTTSLDVPGVKLEDLVVTLRDNSYLSVEAVRHVSNKKREFSKTISIDSDLFNVTKVSARLNHGVLTVAVPRKPEAAPLEIAIDTSEEGSSQTDNNNNDEEERFEFSMDLPGVKKSDVTVKVKDNVLSVIASRTFNSTNKNKKMRIAKETLLDSRVQRSSLRAKLVDGVLTVTAPRDARPAAKTIAVSTGGKGQLIAKKPSAVVAKEDAAVAA